jgi:SOS-response transcriptional repressor LexA
MPHRPFTPQTSEITGTERRMRRSTDDAVAAAAHWPHEPLRPRQAAVLRAIEDYFQSHDRPPTLRDIAHDAEIKSLGHVVTLLKTLEQRGYLTREPGLSASTEIGRGN